MKSPGLPPGMDLNHLFDNPHANAAAVAKEGRFAVFVCHYALLPVPQKITPGFIAVILSQMNGFRHHLRST